MPDPFLTVAERKMLERIANYLLPGSDDLGIADYVENLLSAFDSDPPRIYAGGPFSDRQPTVVNGHPTGPHPPNDFKEYLPLTRLQEIAWQARLRGTQHVQATVAKTEFARQFEGYRKIIGGGLRQAIRFEEERRSKPAPGVDLFMQADGDFKKVLEDLVMEAAFSAPEYGGNKRDDGRPAGWARIGYEGDSAPRGYTLGFDDANQKYIELQNAPVSAPDPGPDPHPLRSVGKLFLRLSTIFNEGKVFK